MSSGIYTCVVCKGPSSSGCKACNAMPYCSTECQKVDWPVHKEQCQHLAGYYKYNGDAKTAIHLKMQRLMSEVTSQKNLTHSMWIIPIQLS
jgi:hypothetical protein